MKYSSVFNDNNDIKIIKYIIKGHIRPAAQYCIHKHNIFALIYSRFSPVEANRYCITKQDEK